MMFRENVIFVSPPPHLPLEGTGKQSKLIFGVLNKFGNQEGKNQRKIRLPALEIIIFIRPK